MGLPSAPTGSDVIRRRGGRAARPRRAGPPSTDRQNRTYEQLAREILNEAAEVDEAASMAAPRRSVYADQDLLVA